MRRQLLQTFDGLPIIWPLSGVAAGTLSDVYITLRRGFRRSPFVGEPKMVVHSTYHKAGSTWLNNVLSDCADHFALFYQNCDQHQLRSRTDIFLCRDSIIDLHSLPPHIGTHMMRDPRDLVVSGYHYHKWTREPWAHRPNDLLDGLSRQEYLNTVDRTTGMKAEILGLRPAISRMLSWPRDNPAFLEIRYEDLIADEEQGFRRMFAHYGFTETAQDEAVKIALGHSFRRTAGRDRGTEQERSHLRSGRARQWEEEFTPELKEYFKEVHGDALITLGYEESNEW